MFTYTCMDSYDEVVARGCGDEAGCLVASLMSGIVPMYMCVCVYVYQP